jgi:hypothetical protein
MLVSRPARVRLPMIIAFPRERCRISAGKIRGPRCTVIILPVVRIERWPEEPERAPRKAKSTTKRTAKTTAKTTAKSKGKTP